MSVQVQRLALFLAIVLLGVYVWANAQPEAAGLIPPPWDKLAHAAWYATLAGLLLLGVGRRYWVWLLCGTLLLAGWDEWHQYALPGRQPGMDDWLADAVGIVLGLWLSGWGIRKRDAIARR